MLSLFNWKLVKVFAGSTLGLVLGAGWFWVVNTMLVEYFPAIEESAIGRWLCIKDTSHIPNVLKFEYDNARAARKKVATDWIVRFIHTLFFPFLFNYGVSSIFTLTPCIYILKNRNCASFWREESISLWVTNKNKEVKILLVHFLWGKGRVEILGQIYEITCVL